MADFRAKIIAELDSAQAESKLKALTTGTHKLKLDLDLNSANSALVNLLNTISAQASKAGSSAGIGFSKSFGASINSIYSKIDTKQVEAKMASLTKKLGSYSSDSSQYKAAQASLQALEKEYAALKAARDAYENKSSTQNANALIKTNEQLTQTMKKAENETRILTSEQSKLLSTQQKAASQNSFTSYFNANTKAAKKYSTEIEALQKQLTQMSTTADKMKFDTAFSNLKTEITKNGDLGKSFGDQFASAASSVGKFVASYMTIQQVIELAKTAASNIIELDSALTNISYTMNLTQSQMSQISQSSIDMSKNLSTSMSNVLQAVQLYANAKESADSIITKAQTAVMMSNVTGMGATDTAKMLQSVMNQFDLTQDDLMSISDTIQTVSQNMAYDFSSGIQEIAQGIQVSGSVAKEAGLDLAQYSSMLGLTIEQTGQSGSTIGRAYSQIFQRITKASQASGTLEEDISKAEESLRAAGVEVRSSEGEFRDLGDILYDLSGKWDTLSSVQKNNIAYNVAGTRQTNIMKTLMTNYQDYLDMVDKAENSSGTTFENQEKYADSLKGKIQELKTTWEAFSVSDSFQATLEGVLDVLKGISTFVTNVASKIGAIKTLAAAFIALKAIKSIGSVGLLTSLSNVGATLSKVFPGITAAIAAMSTAAAGGASAFSILAAGGTALLGALSSIVGLTAGIIAVVGVIDLLTESFSEAQEKSKASRTAYQNTKQEIEKLNTELETTQTRIDELDGKEKLTIVEQAELDKLQTLNDRLLEQKAIQEKIAGIQANEAAKDANNVLTKDSGWYTGEETLVDSAWGGQEYVPEYKTGDIIDKLNDEQSRLIEAKKERDKLLAEQATLEPVESNGWDKFWGNTSQYEKNQAKIEELDKTISSLGSNIAEDTAAINVEYASLFDDKGNIITDYADTAQRVKDAILGTTDAVEQATENAQKADEIVNGSVDFTKAKENLLEMAKANKEVGITADDVRNKYPELASAIEAAGLSVDDFVNDINAQAVAVDEATASVEGYQSVVAKIVEQATSTVSSINAITDAVNAQSTGQTLSLDTYNLEELSDYTSALEYHNGTLRYNAERVNEITKAKAAEEKATIAANKAQDQSQYLKNAGEIEQLRNKLTSATDEERAAIQDSIDALLSENSALASNCAQYDVAAASIDQATSAYQHWLNAQNAAQSGDMFDSSLTAIQKINDTLNNSESDSYGRIGNADYKAALEFVIPDSVDSSDENAINSYLDSISGYLTTDANGNYNGLDISNFCQKAMDAGLMTLDESGKSYEIAGQKTMQDFADGLGLSLPMVQAMFGEMEEFGGNFDWADEQARTFGDLGVAANEAAESLRGVKGNEDLKIAMDVSGFDDANLACQALDDTIAEMNNLKDPKLHPEVDTSQIEQANTVIQYCVAQQQLLNAPAVMHVDTSQVTGEIGDALSLLQEFQTAQNNLDLQASVDADTSEAQAQVDSLLVEMSQNQTITGTLNIDTSSVDSALTSIQNISAEDLTVKYNVDSSLVDNFQGAEHNSDGKVTWKNDSSTVDAYASQMHISNGTVRWANNTSAVKTSFSAPGTINWTNTTPPSSGTHGVNGTAHAYGTARAGGNWGKATGGKTLVGELGREIVVDPHTGRWYTVGDNGAQFVDLPKNAIVFNNRQSESLLENGYVTGRGSALANGTAMVTGGIKVDQANKSTSSSSSSSSSGSSGSSGSGSSGGSSGGSTGGTDKSTKNTKNTIDWIERKLEYFANKVAAIADTITDYVSSSVRKAKLIAQRAAIGNEISVNKKAYDAYSAKASKVKLSASLKKKVREGNYSISDYGSTTQKAIEAYKEYYDKAQDCKTKVIELRNEQLKLFEDLMNIPTDKASKKIDKLSKSYNTLSARASAASTGMSGVSALKTLNSTLVSDAKADRTEAKNTRTTAKSALTTANGNLNTASKKLRTKDKKVKQDKNGYYVLTGLKKNSAQYKRLKAYNDALKKQQSANSSYTSANSAYATANDNYNSTKDLYSMGTYSTSYKYQNALINSELKNQKSQNAANQTALTESNANLTAAKSAQTTANNKVSSKAGSILKSYGKKLTDAQKKALQSGKTVSTKGLSGKALTAVKAYNALVTTATTKTDELKIAQDAQTDAAQTAAESAASLAEAQVQAEQDKFNNVKTYYEAQNDYLDSQKSKVEAINNLKETKGMTLTASDYNSLIANNASGITNLQNEAAKLKAQLASSVNSGVIKKGSEEWKAMQSDILSVETATVNAQKQQEEYNNAVANLPFEKIEKAIELLDTIADYNKSLRDLKSAAGNDLSASDYFDGMKENNDKITQYIESRKQAYANYQKALANSDGVFGGKSADDWKKEYLGYDTSINNLKADNESLKDSLRDDVYWRNFERAHDACKRLKDVLSGLSDLIDSDALFDKNGNMTEYGIANVANLTKQFETARQEVKNYQNDISNLNSLYAQGYYTENEYKEKLGELQKTLLSSASDMKSYQDSIIDMYKNVAQAELDALNELIDKRQDALDKKKAYYDYDKSIKSSTKDIQSLEAQLAALEGIDTAQAKAKKQQLKSDLATAQDELNNTINDHMFDLSKDALDDLKDTLQNAFDDKWDYISGDLDEITKLMASANALTTAGANSVNTTLNKILEYYGINPVDSGIDAAYAKGTSRISKKTRALIGEAGSEIATTQNGLVLTLNPGDGVIPADMTQRLIDMASGVVPTNINVGSSTSGLPSSIQNGNLGNTYNDVKYDSLIHIDGSADAATVEDLKKWLNKSYEYTTQRIYQGAQKAGSKRNV